jgi:integrase
MTKNIYFNMSLIIRQCLDYAVELEVMEENLFRKVKVDARRMFRKVHKKKDSTQVYSKDEVILIFREAWNDFENSKRLVYRLAPLAVMFQFQTGLRIGELCAVKFSDVNNGVLTVCRMLQRDSGKVVDHTKTHDDREVLLTDAALEIIEVARAYQDQNGGMGEYIFSTVDQPFPHREVNVLLKKYCDKLGILYRSSHKSRKTFISSLIDAGININTIRSYVGHADERTTYGSYCFDRTPDTEKKMLLERALVS